MSYKRKQREENPRKSVYRDFTGSPVVKTQHFQYKGHWVQSCIRELRSHMPCSLAKKVSLKEGSVCVCVTDSVCCTSETNAALQSNHSPIRINFKKDIKYILLEDKKEENREIGLHHSKTLLCIKGHYQATSLAVQWLGLHACTPEGAGLIPSVGTKIPQVSQHDKREKKGHYPERKNTNSRMRESICKSHIGEFSIQNMERTFTMQ